MHSRFCKKAFTMTVKEKTIHNKIQAFQIEAYSQTIKKKKKK